MPLVLFSANTQTEYVSEGCKIRLGSLFSVFSVFDGFDFAGKEFLSSVFIDKGNVFYLPPLSILYKSTAGRYRPVRVADPL